MRFSARAVELELDLMERELRRELPDLTGDELRIIREQFERSVRELEHAAVVVSDFA